MKRLFLIACLLLSLPLYAANGDTFGSTFRGDFGLKLLDSQSASDPGTWSNISGIKSASVCFTNVESGATITIYILNDVSTPANATDGFSIASLTSASNQCTLINSSLPARWIKARKAAGGSPQATTLLFWGIGR